MDGLDIRDSGLSNIPRRYNGAPSQDMLVIPQTHRTGERSLGKHTRRAPKGRKE